MSDQQYKLPPDYHTHTQLCKHALGRPVDYAASAKERGLHELAFADHSPAPEGFDPEHRMEFSDFKTYVSWVQEAREQSDLSLLFGIEADYYPGCISLFSRWVAEKEFDLVLGSIHFLDYWAFDNPEERTFWESADILGVWRKYFELLGQMVDSRLYDVVTHLDLPKKFGFRPHDKDVREMVLPLLDRVAARGMAIEINTSGIHHPTGEPYPSPTILNWAHEREIPIVFGSDAHRPEWVGSDFEEAVEIARGIGYTQSARFAHREFQLVPLPRDSL